MCIKYRIHSHICTRVTFVIFYVLHYTQNEKEKGHVRIANVRRFHFNTARISVRVVETRYRHCFQFPKLLWCFCLRLLARKYARCLHSVSSQFVQAHLCSCKKKRDWRELTVLRRNFIPFTQEFKLRNFIAGRDVIAFSFFLSINFEIWFEDVALCSKKKKGKRNNSYF